MTLRPTIGLRREVLPNGVTLLVQQHANAPAAAQVTLVRAGFLDEPDDLVGVSHVLEHMLFKGTPTMGPGELAQRTKELGGSLNAWTSYDQTVYYATMPARHAFRVGALQADQVQRSVIDSGELSRELGVIIQEARRKLDTPSALVGETLHRLLFAEHRIRRWRIGVEQELAQLSDTQVRGYYHSRYRPDRTIVALVGDLDVEQSLEQLRREWSDWRGSNDPIPDGPEERTFPNLGVERFEQDVARADLVLGWRTPGVLHPVAPALDLTAALLSAGRGGWLTRTLRDPGVVAGAGASHYGVADTGVFAISSDTEPARVTETVSGIGSLLNGLRATTPSPSELERSATLIRTRWQRLFERCESRAIAFATAESEGDLYRLDRQEAEWLAVTPELITEMARTHLSPDTLAGVVSLPRGSQVVFDQDLLRQSSAGSRIPEAVVLEPVRVEPTAASGVVQSTAYGVHHLKLDTLDLLTAQHAGSEQVVLQWFGAPPPAEGPQSAGQAALAIRSMLRGTAQRDSAALALSFESLGGTLIPFLSADLVGFGATVLAEHANQAAALLAEVFTCPHFDPAQIEIERRLLLDDARAVADDMLRYPLQLLLGEAFGDQGYGAPPLGTADSLPGLDRNTTVEWHRRWREIGRTTLIAVGPGDPGELAQRLAATVGGFPGGNTTLALPQEQLLMRSGVRRVERERHQSALALLFPGPSRLGTDRFAAELWGAIAGGLGGRLFESLRSQRSLAYTVIATSWQRRRSGGLLTYIATAPERLEEAREAMLEQLEVFRNQPPTTAELERARALLIGQVEISRETATSLAGAIAEAWLFDGNLEQLADPAAGYRTPDLQQLHRVVRAGLDSGVRIEAVVAGEAGG